MTALKIIFAGTPEFGLPCLEALAASEHTLLAIYTQPDRPAGRGQHLTPSPIKQWAIEHAIPVQQPTHFRDPDSIETLAAYAPDILVVIAYGLILPKHVLSIPRLGCINVHASLLPRWRGASPIQQAILHGDTHTGITIMQMDVGMDTGDMLISAKCAIEANDTAQSLHDTLATLAVSPLLTSLEQLSKGTASPQPQNDVAVTYAPKLKKENARINWQQSATSIDCHIRALSPWPIAETYIADEAEKIPNNADDSSAQSIRLRIHKAYPLTTTSTTSLPGTILSIDKQGLCVATGHGVLCIERIQFPNGKVISIRDYINAQRDTLRPGTLFL